MAKELTEQEELAIEEMRAAGVSAEDILDEVQKRRTAKSADETQASPAVTKKDLEQILARERQAQAAANQRERMEQAIQRAIGAKNPGLAGDDGVFVATRKFVGQELAKADVAKLTEAELEAKLAELATGYVERLEKRVAGEKEGAGDKETAGDKEGAKEKETTEELETRLKASKRKATDSDGTPGPGTGEPEGELPTFKFGEHGRTPENPAGVKYPSMAEIRRDADKRFAHAAKKYGW